MATHPRDGETEVPVKRERLPLAEVMFISPTKIPGLNMMLTTLEAGVNRLVDGREWSPPPMWLDPIRRVVIIEDYSYPLERVHCYRQARAAITKKPAKLDVSKYTIGKRTLL